MLSTLDRIPVAHQEVSALKAVLILLLSTLVFVSPPFSPAGAEMFENASEARLANGLKVIMLENHKAPVVCFQVWYKIGAAEDTTGKTGLARMVEKMMFKGVGEMSGEKFIATIHQLGGAEYGVTSHDYTCYYEILPSASLEVAIKFEADRMQNLKLRESDFRTEKMVSLQERRMRIDDNPGAYLMEQLHAAAFQAEPYHWPVMGWSDDIGRLTMGDVSSFYSKYYDPANAFIVVTGDFSKEKLLPRIEEAFGKIPPGEPVARFLMEDPPQRGERTVVVRRPTRTGRMIVAWHVPNLKSDDCYVLEVIKAILSSGKSARLYEDLIRQNAVVLDASAHYDQVTRDPGLFYICSSFLLEKKPPEVEKALCEELEALGKTPIGALELQKAKNQLEASFVFDHESIISMASRLAEYETAFDWASISAYIPSIRSVTAQDVQRVAAKYFTEQNRTVAMIVPPLAVSKADKGSK